MKRSTSIAELDSEESDHKTKKTASKLEIDKDSRELINTKLKELAAIYESSRDRFRANSYKKAITALKNHEGPIRNKQDALKIPGVGKAIANKIFEIMETGKLAKLNLLQAREDVTALQLFTKMHGVGPITAQQFVTQGLRTLKDLQESELKKPHLNHQQKIGLKHYDSFLKRIPRAEATKIESFVKEECLMLNQGAIVQACGSYRRGKATCGDVDIIITHQDGKSHSSIFHKLVEILHSKSKYQKKA